MTRTPKQIALEVARFRFLHAAAPLDAAGGTLAETNAIAASVDYPHWHGCLNGEGLMRKFAGPGGVALYQRSALGRSWADLDDTATGHGSPNIVAYLLDPDTDIGRAVNRALRGALGPVRYRALLAAL